MQTTTRLKSAALMCLTVAMIATGCTSKGENSASDGASTSKAGVSSGVDSTGDPDSIEIPKKTIGVLLYVGASYVQHQMANELTRSASALGWKVVVKDAQGQPGLMSSISQSFVQQKVDAFVSISAPPSNIKPALQAFKKAGTPVVNLAGIVPNEDRLYAGIFRASEAVQGAMAADYVGSTLKPGSEVVLQSFSVQMGVKMRTDGFRTLMKSYGVKIAAEHQIDAANLISDTISSVRNQLTANPDAKVIFSAIDAQLAPICSLLKERRRTDVKIISIYTIPDTAKALETCDSAVVIDADGWYASWQSIDALLHYFTKKTPIDANAVISRYPYSYQVVTKKNMPKGLKSYPFPDIGKTMYADWKAEGYKLRDLPAPTTAVK